MAYITAAANSTDTTITASVALTYNTALASGASLVAGVRVGAVLISGGAFSDSVNGAWTDVSHINDLTTNQLYVGRFPNSAAGTPTVTFTGDGNPHSCRWFIVAYDGVSAASSDGAIQFQTVATTTTPATPGIATANATDYLISIGEADSGLTSLTENASGSNPSSGWTSRIIVISGGVAKLWMSDNTTSSTGTYNETWTTSNDDFATAILALKQSGAAAPTFFEMDKISSQVMRTIKAVAY